MIPIAPGRGVRPMTRADIEPLSRVLARAFRDDPFHRWIFPSHRAWARRSHRSFAGLIHDNIERGGLLTTENGEGAAIWLPPGLPQPGALEQIAMAVRMLAVFGRRFFRVTGGFQRMMARHPREPHWYLAVLGTDPVHQGKGVGSALIEPVLEHCEREALVAYLEASRIENVPYYQRFGFEVREEIAMPADGPSVWAMAWTPSSRRGSP